MFSKKLNLAHEQFYQFKLFRSENVGAITYSSLLRAYGSAEAALENIEKLAANGGLKRKIAAIDDAAVSKEIELIEEKSGHIIFKNTAHYPMQFGILDDSPPFFTAFGNIDVLKNNKFIGVVGSRNASMNGCKLAKHFANSLAKNKVATVSGLALGIDTYAHEGSLEYGTIAVLAGGADVLYPPQNKQLYQEILETGVIISEKPLGMVPIAQYFPQRNRIISGLSNGIIVIEASLKSGSLITANFALKQKRKVFAVPGSPLDDRSKGCNELIKKQQAILLDNIEQVIEFVDSKTTALHDSDKSLYACNSTFAIPSDSELTKYRHAIYTAISFEETDIESIISHHKIPMNILNVLLLELELAGKIRRTYPNKITRIEE